jgi:hypothetical protein
MIPTLALQSCKSLLSIHSSHSTFNHVVITLIEHLAGLGNFLEIAHHRVLHEIIGTAPTFSSQGVEFGFGFRFQAYLHGRSLGIRRTGVKHVLTDR